MGVDSYPNMEGKIALCLESSMIAKEYAVSEMGVGEDLTFSIFGWAGENLRVIASLSQDMMGEDPEKRLERVAVCATVLRKGWGCDALSFVAEAFCSTDADATKGKDLRKMFIKPDSPVFECLTVTHVEPETVMLVSQPYKVLLGRKVEWLPTLVNSDAKGLRDAKYPAVLNAVLQLESNGYASPDDEPFFEALAEGMAEDGFSVQWTFD